MKHSPLHTAYAAARYRIDCSGRTVERRIGAVDPDADRVLAGMGCRARWHVLTPCNPGSRHLSSAENAARLDALRKDLQQRGWRALPSINSDADGAWVEAGFCVLDASAPEIRTLATHYGQAAFVAGTLGKAPRLVWT